MYACVGLWCQAFIILYASTELSNIMKWATRCLKLINKFDCHEKLINSRSAEEIFSLFIAIAFIVEAFKALHLSEWLIDLIAYWYGFSWLINFNYNQTIKRTITRQLATILHLWTTPTRVTQLPPIVRRVNVTGRTPSCTSCWCSEHSGSVYFCIISEKREWKKAF